MPKCPYCNNDLIVSLQAEVKLKKKEPIMEDKKFNGLSTLIDFDDSKGINHFNSRNGTKIDKIVLHSTGSEKADRDSVVNWFRDPSSKVSSHYLITNDGKICGLVTEEKRAWHCGNGNSSSVGVEVAGACGLKQYKQAQMLPLAKLIKDIRSRYGNIPIVTHADIDPVRKTDDPFIPARKLEALKEIEALIATL